MVYQTNIYFLGVYIVGVSIAQILKRLHGIVIMIEITIFGLIFHGKFLTYKYMC